MNTVMLRTKIIAAAVIAAFLTVPALALAAVNWQIAMHGSAAYPKASGSAQYQSQPGQREVQVELQHARSLAGRMVIFSAGGMRLGSQKVSRRGQADITRNTETGQKVPTITHGARVSVRTATGKLVTAGKF